MRVHSHVAINGHVAKVAMSVVRRLLDVGDRQSDCCKVK